MPAAETAPSGMRVSLKAKQVAGVTLIVGLAVAISSLLQLIAIAQFSLEESAVRGELLARTIFQQAGRVAGSPDAWAALRTDAGVRTTLEAAIAYAPNVTYAVIVDGQGTAMAHSTPALEGQAVSDQGLLRDLLGQPLFERVRAIYSDRTFEVRERLLTQSGDEFGAIRIGMSMLLVRSEVSEALWPATVTTVGAIAVALVVATSFAQWLLRPIAIVQTGLARLGRGEVNVKLELPPDDVFGELGQSFDTVSATLAAARSQQALQPAALDAAVDRLEDAVAVYDPRGELLFANPAMKAIGPPDAHPYRSILERVLAGRASVGPESLTIPGDEAGEHVVVGHALTDHDGRFVGLMLVGRNVAYRSQLQSTLKYSQKVASLNRLLAGVAHEVKNPLNAMTIHLELLKQKLTAAESARGEPGSRGAGDFGSVQRHAAVIGQEIHRLDDVVQGFLKFSRPEELAIQRVSLRALVDEVFTLVAEEAAAQRVALKNVCPRDLPAAQGDPTLLRQAFLNLALNACQAMPEGGMLSIRGRRAIAGVVELEFA
ncbi:MAG: histidine kinase dimerization/phospho-acceptor domain-containing protein, partial [Vicinamibacterales bacterium]